MKRALLVAAFLAAGCGGNPQGLPISVEHCRAPADGVMRLVAEVQNKSDRPIAQIDLSVTFYQYFRYETYVAGARMRKELDPGERRDVTFNIDARNVPRARGQALRCFATHLRYLDASTQDAATQDP